MTRSWPLLLIATLLAACSSTAEREAEDARRQRVIDTNVQLATGYLQRGQLEFAKEKLERALALDANDVNANTTMALLQWRLKDYAVAEEHFRRSVRAEKGNGEARNNYGVFLCERGRIDEAVKWFRLAVQDPLYSTPAVANQNAGLCLAKTGAVADAEPFFREALKLNPGLAPALEQMARISLDIGKPLAARGFMQRYFQAGQDTPDTLWLAIRIERALGHKNEEASYALRLRAKFPESPEAKRLGKPMRTGKGRN